MKNLKSIFIVLLMSISLASAQYNFAFERNLKSGSIKFKGNNIQYTEGIEGFGLYLNPDNNSQYRLEEISLDGSSDFSIQFWIKTRSKKPMVFLTQKIFKNKSISSQKNPGWALYSSQGTLAWCIGSGDRRISYERDNSDKMPLNDGKWHQISLTYNNSLAEVRLYYDGRNFSIYKVGFDFASQHPLIIGSQKDNFDYVHSILPKIKKGRENLQK